MAVVQQHSLAATTPPKVSVCVANFNGESLLTPCLDSILSQDAGVPIEIIVHDDASTDASISLLRSQYPEVKVIESKVNVGFCKSNNRMAEQARGEFVLLLNNDAALPPGAIRDFLRDASSSKGPTILSLPQIDWETGALVDRGCLLDPFHNPIPNLDPNRHDVAYVIGACLWIAKNDWNRLGGFPEEFGSLAEDMYLCCLARLRGMGVRVLDSAGYRHRQGASFGGNRVDSGRMASTFRRRALSERNKTVVVFVCTPSPMAWGLLAVHLIALAAEGIVMALVKRDLRLWREVYWQAISFAVGHWRSLAKRRRDAQQGKQCSLGGYLKAFRWIPWKLVMLCRYGLPNVR